MDTTIKYEDYAFIGYDFLTTAYYLVNTKEDFNFRLGKKVVFAKFFNDKIFEKIVISGDDSDTESGKLLLSEGALVVEMQLILEDDGDEYLFTLKGKEMAFNGFKAPNIELYGDPDEYEGSIIDKIAMCGKAFELFDDFFGSFIKIRINDEKWNKARLDIINFSKIDRQQVNNK